MELIDNTLPLEEGHIELRIGDRKWGFKFVRPKSEYSTEQDTFWIEKLLAELVKQLREDGVVIDTSFMNGLSLRDYRDNLYKKIDYLERGMPYGF